MPARCGWRRAYTASARQAISTDSPRACRLAASPVDSRNTRRMIRKLASGQYRLYSRKLDPKTGKRRNLGTFDSRAAAEKHEREVQYFKRH